MMDVIYCEDGYDADVESITTDTEHEIRQRQPIVEARITLESATAAIQARIRPIVREPRTEPICLTKPIQDTVFACFDDHLAAIKSQ